MGNEVARTVVFGIPINMLVQMSETGWLYASVGAALVYYRLLSKADETKQTVYDKLLVI